MLEYSMMGRRSKQSTQVVLFFASVLYNDNDNARY